MYNLKLSSVGLMFHALRDRKVLHASPPPRPQLSSVGLSLCWDFEQCPGNWDGGSIGYCDGWQHPYKREVISFLFLTEKLPPASMTPPAPDCPAPCSEFLSEIQTWVCLAPLPDSTLWWMCCARVDQGGMCQCLVSLGSGSNQRRVTVAPSQEEGSQAGVGGA